MKIATAFAAASLLVSTSASAAVRAGDHVVTARLISASVQTAVCTTGAAAAGAAAQAAPAQPGCVLPVVDPAAAPVAEVPAPVYVPPAEAPAAGIGILPLLLGLAAVAGLAYLLLDEDGADDIDLPLSPG